MTEATVTSRDGRWRTLAIVVALLALVIDQAHKLYMLRVVEIALTQPIELTPFFELIMVWNYGISYGLFQQHSDTGRWVLIVISFAAAIGLMIWAWRTPVLLVALSAALIAGGAVGNGIDRIVYGAVADFFHFHVGSFSWYVFNFADVFIVAGVMGLIIDQVILARSPQK